MPSIKRKVMVLASGGDAPGMNACLYYLVKMLEDKNFEVLGCFGGFQGLIENEIKPIKSSSIKPFLQAGGSFIRAGRSSQFLLESGKTIAAKHFASSGAECAVIIGGNGSFQGMLDVNPYGVKTIGVPATIDNDIFYTDYSLGFDSAANENLRLVKNIKACCEAQNKLPIVEIMGRDCSKLAYQVAIGSGADILIAKEYPQTEEEIIAKVKNKIKISKSLPLIISIEKYINLESLAEKITKATKKEAKIFVNGYQQRGGDATNFDIMLGYKLACKAVNQVIDKNYLTVVGIKNDVPFVTPVEKALKVKSTFDIENYKNMFM